MTLAARALGEAVRLRPPELAPMLMVFRSTMLPGSMRRTVLPAVAAAAGEPLGTRYEIAYSPEFTREGTALADYFAPARIVVGEGRPRSRQILLDLHPGIEAPIFSTSFEVAELTKLADNSFHALKVAFANEVGRFALSSGISPSEVFDIFQADTKLNLSSAYLRPGGAFGGPCLPKDVLALAASMDNAGVTAPVIGHINESNASHTNFLVSEIERRLAPRSRVLLLGLSFKPGTDDVRESPFLAFAEQLLSRGHALSIYDPDLCGDGASRGRMSLPSHLSACVLRQLPAELAFDLVVVGKNSLGQASLPPGCPVFFASTGFSSVRGRILIIDHRIPTPDKDSGSRSTFSYLQILSRAGFDVTFVPADLKPAGRYGEALNALGVTTVTAPEWTSLKHAIKSFAPRSDLLLLYRAPVAARVFDLARTAAPHARILFQAVDLHFLRMEREAELNGHQAAKERASAMRKTELDLINRADASIVVSSYERSLLHELAPQASVHEIPILIEMPRRPPGELLHWHARRLCHRLGSIGRRLNRRDPALQDDRLFCSWEGSRICRTGTR